MIPTAPPSPPGPSPQPPSPSRCRVPEPPAQAQSLGAEEVLTQHNPGELRPRPPAPSPLPRRMSPPPQPDATVMGAASVPPMASVPPATPPESLLWGGPSPHPRDPPTPPSSGAALLVPRSRSGVVPPTPRTVTSPSSQRGLSPHSGPAHPTPGARGVPEGVSPGRLGPPRCAGLPAPPAAGTQGTGRGDDVAFTLDIVFLNKEREPRSSARLGVAAGLGARAPSRVCA